VDTGQQFLYQKGNITTGAKLRNGHHIESWGESGMAVDTSQQTDTSTDVDTDDKNQVGVCFFTLFSAFKYFVEWNL
jgi:transcription factor TGA